MCVWFSLQLLSDSCLSLGRNERDLILKMCIGLRVNYPSFLSDFDETWFSRQIFEKKNRQTSNFMNIRLVVAELFHTNRSTDMTNLIVAFRNFENAPKMPER
jgi:hypothetical protein